MLLHFLLLKLVTMAITTNSYDIKLMATSVQNTCAHINREFASCSETVTLAMKCVFNVSVSTQHIVIVTCSE